jgi:hypothetical protein
LSFILTERALCDLDYLAGWLGYELDDWDLIPGRCRMFFFYYCIHSLCSPPIPHPLETRGYFFHGVKWLGHESDRSPPCGGELKNAEDYICTPSLSSWCGAWAQNFTLLYQ